MGKLNFSGRNTSGHITTRHKGAAKFFKHANVSFSYLTKINCVALVVNIFYSFLYKKFITLLKYANGSFCLSFLVNGIYIGDYINNNFAMSRISLNRRLGMFILLKNLEQNMVVSNLSANTKNTASYARASGTFCKILKKFNDINLAQLVLPSGESKFFSLTS
jgi:large subunit ribosomal protein L2